MYLDYFWKTLTELGNNQGRFKPLGLPLLLALVTLSTVSCTTSPQSSQSPQSPVVNPSSPPIQDDRGSDTPDEMPIASSVLPQTNAQGDYTGKSNHINWRVVDPDPNGLNCRMGDRTIIEVWNPSAGALNIGSWPVTGTLPPDSTFQAALSPGGFILTFDSNNQTWIFVESSNGPEQTSNCFIRANINYVEPVSNSR
ncbi:hypothetical protein J0895_00130 [Phormidium pseudopriestleyi FRX01]|uniref:Lamin tail domain-containing protein n=1 Tax=Phormidium pseudopriestleyi FRX01 TaxID=1759528 RepID=A0ABS3FKN4_9CYAN|nr:hypothetical protein [Phormidium pseudopriestleyi]MBO0347544.1 hypothetical protein [Phormidium pseudopriestleyi FRX01]